MDPYHPAAIDRPYQLDIDSVGPLHSNTTTEYCYGAQHVTHQNRNKRYQRCAQVRPEEVTLQDQFQHPSPLTMHNNYQTFPMPVTMPVTMQGNDIVCQ